MIIEKTYKILINKNKTIRITRITTSLTEREFLKTLDRVYGMNNYKILEIS